MYYFSDIYLELGWEFIFTDMQIVVSPISRYDFIGVERGGRGGGAIIHPHFPSVYMWNSKN